MTYSRFYALLNRMPVRSGDIKEALVSEYTSGRTTSLREMSDREYEDMCAAMERTLKNPFGTEELKKRRSAALRLIQKLDIDTTDWVRVNAFCQDRRIAGKVFSALTLEELDALTTKLRGIQRKGGLRAFDPTRPQRPELTAHVFMMPDNGVVN